MRKLLAVAALALTLSGCYHATIDTGRTPSGQVIERDWAHGFVYGLVPPSTVETASRCPNGVARVETQLSFLNQLTTFLTWGLYTPMEITVQCAAPGGENDTLAAREGEPAAATLARAIQQSARTGEAVFIRF